MIEEKILKRIEGAIEANGGEEFKQNKCECTENAKCAYCKIFYTLLQCKDYIRLKMNGELK